MNIEVIKTSNEQGAVFVKYKTHKLSPECNITLPFHCGQDGMVEFKITEEFLRDIVNLIQRKFGG
jgi:hypothetical protein